MKRKPAELVAEIREYCAAHADPALATKWARYFTEGYDAWGLLDKENPFFTTRQAGWLEEYASLGLNGFLSAGTDLCSSGKYEEAAIATRFLKEHRDLLTASSVPKLAQWFKGGIRNWAHVDVLCMEVLTPCLAAGQFPLTALAAWRDSEWKYQRRASVVALIPPPKDPRAIPPLLEYIRPLMHDVDKPVQQALGWFLREAWKVAPKPVEALLLEFVATAPRQIYQTATEKMPAEKKARFKRPPSKVR